MRVWRMPDVRPLNYALEPPARIFPGSRRFCTFRPSVAVAVQCHTLKPKLPAPGSELRRPKVGIERRSFADPSLTRLVSMINMP
jgi:hypothetical protein